MLLRLGGEIVQEGTPCAHCGWRMDAHGRHAMRCAPGQSTRGHNRLRNTLHGLASMSDGGAVTEAAGLLESAPALRPADLLTHAAFGKQMAFDISVANGGGENGRRRPMCVSCATQARSL